MLHRFVHAWRALGRRRQLDGHLDEELRFHVDLDRLPVADFNTVSGEYFETLGIRLISGGTFLATDSRDSTRVVVINRTMARYWESGDPLGSRVSFDRGESWATIVGVVSDVRQYGLAREAVAQVYTPLSQTQGGLPGRVLVRTAGDPLQMGQVVRAAVRALDPNQPVENIQTLEQLRAEHLATPRLTALLLSLFAGVALLVTLAGIAGVIATWVSRRTQEFGIRMALGASRAHVLLGVLRQGLLLVVTGLVTGLARLPRSAAYCRTTSTTRSRPTRLRSAFAALACLCAGAVACLGPARRATTIDPILALREE